MDVRLRITCLSRRWSGKDLEGHMGSELEEIAEEEAEASKTERINYERSYVCWHMCVYVPG